MQDRMQTVQVRYELPQNQKAGQGTAEDPLVSSLARQESQENQECRFPGGPFPERQGSAYLSDKSTGFPVHNSDRFGSDPL
jgi:hypothetical protein